MPKLLWDQIGEREYESGVSHGVLYPQVNGLYPAGVAWNGLTAVNESPTGGEATPLYADNMKYLNLMSNEEYAAAIEAYMYPDEFGPCNGEVALAPGITVTQQTRQAFGFSYRTGMGNDVDFLEHGYKIHLVYGALASPADKSYETVNETPDAITFSYDITTTPVPVTGKKPTAHLIIDSTEVDAADLALLEAALYGTTEAAAYLPLPDAVLALIA
jgi:hypothetical protein